MRDIIVEATYLRHERARFSERFRIRLQPVVRAAATGMKPSHEVEDGATTLTPLVTMPGRRRPA